MASRRCRRAVERQQLLLAAVQSRRHRWQICSLPPSASCRSPTALNSTSGSLSTGCSPRATLGSRSRRLPEPSRTTSGVHCCSHRLSSRLAFARELTPQPLSLTAARSLSSLCWPLLTGALWPLWSSKTVRGQSGLLTCTKGTRNCICKFVYCSYYSHTHSSLMNGDRVLRSFIVVLYEYLWQC